MFRQFSKVKIPLLLVLVMFVVVACGQSKDATDHSTSQAGGSDAASRAKIDLRFMAAPQAGSWYPLAVQMTELMKKNIGSLGQISIEPGGGVSNVVAVNNGQGQMGYSQTMPIYDGLQGVAPFNEKMENIRYMFTLYPHYSTIAVLKDSGITKIEDLKGKRINVGAKGLAGEVLARLILDLYGMSYEDMANVQYLSFSDGVEQMKDGRIDAFFVTSPIPFTPLVDLNETKHIELLPLPEDKLNELIRNNPSLYPTQIPKGTYSGIEKDTPTVQTPLVVIANKDTDEELVYNTVKTVYEGLEEMKKANPLLKNLTQQDLYSEMEGLEVHPGAKRFFQEKGIMK